MKYYVNLFIISVFLLLFSCKYSINNKDNNLYYLDTIFDTIKIYQTVDTFELKSNFIKKDLEDLYNFIKKREINELLFNEINNLYTNSLMVGILCNEKIVNDIVLLFFLKLHNSYIYSDYYGYNVSCCTEDNVFLMLFLMQYVKISGHKPTEILLSKMVYDWVKNNKKFTNNIDMQEQIEDINLKYKNRK